MYPSTWTLGILLVVACASSTENTLEKREFSDYSDDGDIWEYQKFQHYGFKTPSPSKHTLSGLIAFLAPLAALPIIASAALSGLATILPTMTVATTNSGRRKREIDDFLFLAVTNFSNRTRGRNFRGRQLHDLDIIQKYLQQAKPRDGNHDEVLATYLSCSGMLDANNHCLEKLVCQFSDITSNMSQLEKDVSSLIIYTILRNKYIDDHFKERLRKSAFFGRDYPGRCRQYLCSRVSYDGHHYVH